MPSDQCWNFPALARPRFLLKREEPVPGRGQAKGPTGGGLIEARREVEVEVGPWGAGRLQPGARGGRALPWHQYLQPWSSRTWPWVAGGSLWVDGG